jgi:hypothetical protein
MLVVIDAALTGVLVATLLLLATAAGIVVVVAGVVAFVVVLALGVEWMTRMVAGTASGLAVNFPSPPAGQAAE